MNTGRTTFEHTVRKTNLKIMTNVKAGAAASNPSLLNPVQVKVAGLHVRTTVMGGAKPCTSILYCE